MIHFISQFLRYLFAGVIGWLTTTPFYINNTEHTAAAIVIASVMMVLVDIRMELSQAREPTGWFK